MEVPRLGVELDLKAPAYTVATAMRIQATSATYTTAHGNAFRTHILMGTRVLVGFFTSELQEELLLAQFIFYAYGQKLTLKIQRTS